VCELSLQLFYKIFFPVFKFFCFVLLSQGALLNRLKRAAENLRRRFDFFQGWWDPFVKHKEARNLPVIFLSWRYVLGVFVLPPS
jgi:hypothetical protein